MPGTSNYLPWKGPGGERCCCGDQCEEVVAPSAEFPEVYFNDEYLTLPKESFAEGGGEPFYSGAVAAELVNATGGGRLRWPLEGTRMRFGFAANTIFNGSGFENRAIEIEVDLTPKCYSFRDACNYGLVITRGATMREGIYTNPTGEESWVAESGATETSLPDFLRMYFFPRVTKLDLGGGARTWVLTTQGADSDWPVALYVETPWFTARSYPIFGSDEIEHTDQPSGLGWDPKIAFWWEFGTRTEVKWTADPRSTWTYFGSFFPLSQFMNGQVVAHESSAGCPGDDPEDYDRVAKSGVVPLPEWPDLPWE
jgi:hypothetical protein